MKENKVTDKKKPDEKKSNENTDGKISDELRGLAEEIATFSPADKEPIVQVGMKLEKVWTTLKVGGADKAISDSLKQCLSILQAFYQDKLSDATTVWPMVGETLHGVEDALVGLADGPSRMTKACKALKSLTKSAKKAAPKSAAPAQAPSQAEVQNPQAVIEGIAAKLVGYAPDELDELANLGKELLSIISCPSVAGGAIGHLTIATQLIETVVQGKAEKPEEILTQAAKAIGTAVDVQEAAQEAQAVAQEQPAAETPPDVCAPAPPAEAPVPAQPPAPKAEKVEFSNPAIMAEDTDAELLNEYIVESSDHITNAEGALLELESNPDNRDQIDVVFRAYHTIKGTSGFLGFDRIQKCAHLAENLLDRARGGEIKIQGGYADLCLRSCDCLRTMLLGLEGLESGDALPIPEELDDLLTILSNPEAAGYSAELAEVDDMRVGDIIVGKGEVTRRAVEKSEKTKGDKKLGEKLVTDGTASAAQVVDAIRTQKQLKQGKGAAIEGTIRVGTSRLDSLINMVGELVIAQSMVAADTETSNDIQPGLRRNISHAGKIIRELQDLTMSLRMVPLKSMFQKMNRLVRDLARKSGKQVVFNIEGEDTEIDRNMVESLNDPLVHMIRNSVDHGIESPEVRTAAGKNPSGNITLRAYHAAGNVVIELHDDGKGLDRERILAKAVDKGLVEKGREMIDNDVFMLIFAAGFSTAEKVTDVSGRGVGMDVVKRNIESLRGRVDVTSTAGQGSTFTVRVPLTMAIADAMVLRVGQDRYLLPTVSIEQSFQPEEDSISTVIGAGEMVMFRGDLLPVFRLHKLFDIEGAQTNPYQGLLIAIEGDGRRCALMVDELLGQQQVVIKTLGRGITKIPGIAGASILGDGRVGLILDATGLLQLAEGLGSGAGELEPAMAF